MKGIWPFDFLLRDIPFYKLLNYLDVVLRRLASIGPIIKSEDSLDSRWTAYRDPPPKLSEEQLEQLAHTVLHQHPVDAGFEAHYTWTLALIAAWVQHTFQISYTLRCMSKVLHRLGFSFTKATYTLENAEEAKQAEFREETFPALEQKLLEGEIDHLLFEDESTIRAYQALQYN